MMAPISPAMAFQAASSAARAGLGVSWHNAGPSANQNTLQREQWSAPVVSMVGTMGEAQNGHPIIITSTCIWREVTQT